MKGNEIMEGTRGQGHSTDHCAFSVLSGHALLSNSSEPWANLWLPEGVPSANTGESQLNAVPAGIRGGFSSDSVQQKIKPTGSEGTNPVDH